MTGMPLDILLVAVSQKGTSSRHRSLKTLAAACDTDDELVRRCAAGGRPMLAKITPYRDLMLTSSEMEQLVAELRSLDVSASGSAVRIVDEVVALAERCAADATTELHFICD
ncbi:hypothetical protein NKG05_28125 [Oerskovia sp. M15]